MLAGYNHIALYFASKYLKQKKCEMKEVEVQNWYIQVTPNEQISHTI